MKKFKPSIIGNLFKTIFTLGWYRFNKALYITNYNASTSADATYHKGIIFKSQFSFKACDVRSIKIKQNILQKIMGYGTISISTSGVSGDDLKLKNFRQPQKIKELLKS